MLVGLDLSLMLIVNYIYIKMINGTVGVLQHRRAGGSQELGPGDELEIFTLDLIKDSCGL